MELWAKAIEVFGCIERSDVDSLVNFLWLASASPLIPLKVRSGNYKRPSLNRAKKTHVCLWLEHPALPWRVSLTIYEIRTTKDYPAKIELAYVSDYGGGLPEKEVPGAVRILADMLRVILVAAGVPTLALYGKMHGDPVDVSTRGADVNQGLLRAAVASCVFLPEPLTGDVIRKHIGLYLGRPLVATHGLRDAHPAISRIRGSKAYEIVFPPREAVPGMKRAPVVGYEDGIERLKWLLAA